MAYINYLGAGRELGDVHRYNLDAQTWEEVATPANPLPPRSMFGGAHVMGRLIVLACGEVRVFYLILHGQLAC